ncbi:hypothetical protein C498_10731 [Haloferax volcanii DS2]|uniref:Transmembrane protein n=1 Tax=Haloferax volcanii (strain ATCC 29605 / DSM 3757 / JCM 8879 / NBRC 14742 / NCIMB 2012 / VKM B-1768 / DS2) TaxID=309800 RepID=L9UW99_HALVD|nr:hypothetical protein C498_10731 [Haloferax volcanii DS2]
MGWKYRFRRRVFTNGKDSTVVLVLVFNFVRIEDLQRRSVDGNCDFDIEESRTPVFVTRIVLFLILLVVGVVLFTVSINQPGCE